MYIWKGGTKDNWLSYVKEEKDRKKKGKIHLGHRV